MMSCTHLYTDDGTVHLFVLGLVFVLAAAGEGPPQFKNKNSIHREISR